MKIRAVASILGLSILFGMPAWAEATIKRAAAQVFLEVEALRRENPQISLADMERARGVRKGEYPLSDIEFYLEESTAEAQALTLEEEAAAGGYRGPKTFPWLALRRSYTDVLASEDPTLANSG